MMPISTSYWFTGKGRVTAKLLWAAGTLTCHKKSLARVGTYRARNRMPLNWAWSPLSPTMIPPATGRISGDSRITAEFTVNNAILTVNEPYFYRGKTSELIARQWIGPDGGRFGP